MSEETIHHLLGLIADKSARQKSEQAFKTLYLDYSRTVRNFIGASLTSDTSLVEEIVQDTFLEVWKHPERFRGDAQFKTWLLSIARFKTIDVLRKQRVEWEQIRRISPKCCRPGNLCRTRFYRTISWAKLSCFSVEKLSAKGKLSAEHREVLHLVYIEDQDIAEAARIIGCPPNTVETRLHHARLKIKECLARCLPEGGEFGYE